MVAHPPSCAQELLLLLRRRRRVATLLIDNYDSYTYNIYQMLAQVNGVAPVVFRNDDFGGDWTQAWRAFQVHVQQQFGRSDGDVELNVVISPGPGHPAVPGDFGMCADAIRYAQVPLLGVCLGHQGLAQVYGGKVVNAPEVMHGRTSKVFFSDKASAASATDKEAPTLFSRIPNGFEVVRYHSLVADEGSLPAELTVTARTKDGVVMALQHASKQQFGVQFHPEAVCSGFGYQLFQNFRDITLQQPPSQCPLQHSSLQPHVLERTSVDAIHPRAMVDETAPEYKVQVRVASRGLASLDFAQSVFSDLYASSKRAFWLDSSNFVDNSSSVQAQAQQQQQQTSRFSLMGDSAGPLSYSVEYCILENLLRVYESDGETVLYEHKSDIMTHLRSKMAAFQAHDVEFLNDEDDKDSISETPFAFRGGFVGYFGYEVLGSGLQDPSNSDPSASPIKGGVARRLQDGDYVPDASFLFADRTLVFDHVDSKVYSVSVSRAGNSKASDLWHSEVAAQLQRIQEMSESQSSTTGTRSPIDHLLVDQVVFHPSRSKKQYRRDIAEIQRLIHEGETYEVCLTNQLEAAYSLKDPLGFYELLRKRNPAPYAGLYLINPVGHFQTSNVANGQQPHQGVGQNPQPTGMTDSYAICCSSPERFLRVGGDGWMESKPIKGTRRRGLNPQEDLEIANELADCMKDRAENMMIADLVRNDFGVVAQIGSVHVPKLMAVETYATVHQLVTTVRGQQRADADVVDILNATFPGGSMTGAPKKRTMQLIRQLEQGPRGVYSGALGFLSLDGSCDLNIVIRTAVITRKRVTLGSGGAIIALSDTDEEYEEMLLKTRALVQAIGAFATGKHDGTGARVDAGL
ncbi:Para-aminobenzoate synthase [Globisporangium polare]